MDFALHQALVVQLLSQTGQSSLSLIFGITLTLLHRAISATALRTNESINKMYDRVESVGKLMVGRWDDVMMTRPV